MRRLVKKIVAAALAMTMTLAVATTCMAATWTGYFGSTDTNGEWYEASEGKLTSSTGTAWTANMVSLGWGGIWGAQVYRNDVKIVKGQKYKLSFTMKSSNCDKWVYIKIAKGETIAFADWVQLKRGQNYNYNKTFTAKVSTNTIYFGLGGEMGDRDSVATDTDAAYRYSLLKTRPSDNDPTYSTVVTMSKFSLGSAKPGKVSLKSVKASKGGKAKVTYRKVTGAKKYQIQYSLKSNFKGAKKVTSSKTTATIKKLKKGKKYYVRVRVYNSSKEYGDWSNKKTVKAK